MVQVSVTTEYVPYRVVARKVVNIIGTSSACGQLTKWLNPNEVIPAQIGCPSALVWARWMCANRRGWYVKKRRGRIAIFNRLIEKKNYPPPCR